MAPGTLLSDKSKPEVSWELTAREVEGMAKGTKIQSECFKLLGLDGDFRLDCYPAGESNAENGQCSVYLRVSVATALRSSLTVNTTKHVLRGTIAANCSTGFGSAALVESGYALRISLQVHDWHQSPKKDAPVHDLTAELLQALARTGSTQAEVDALTAQLLEAQAGLKAMEAEAAQQSALLSQAQAETARVKAILNSAVLGATASHRAAVVAIQRAWRRSVARSRRARDLAEHVRRLQWARQERLITAVQRRWREHRQDLQRRKQGIHNRRSPPPRPASKYDAIVNFRSLVEFTATGGIEVLRAVESRLNISLEANYRIVAVVGLFDKGKTFLINKLFDVNLPAGKLHTTQGFSFFLVEERRMLILDSAGVQGTVSYKTQAMQPILDAQSTESFMFEMISRIAHHMIFVVNDLTWFEQKYIAMLHQKYVQKNQAKELIVVHNLRSTGSVKEAQQLFQQQIVQCYEGQASHLTELSFTANRGADVPHVQHFGICEDCTEAGEKFNDANCKLIMQMLELRDMLGSPVLLSKLLKEEMDQLLPIFLNVEVGETGTTRPQASLIVDFVPVQDAANVRDGYEEAGRLVLRSSPAEGRVVMKTRGVISDLGEIIAHDITFKPIVNIYDKGRDRDVRRIIEVECPGVRAEDVEWEERPNGVRLIIEKSKGIDEVCVQPVAPIRQCHGRWAHDFDFETSEGKFELCSEEISMEHGLLVVPLRRWAQARKGRLGSRRPTGATNVTEHYNVGTPGPGSISSTIITSGFTDLGGESTAE